jgi:hypothetical protein
MMDAVECMKAVTRMLKSGTIDCAIQKYISAQKKNDYEGMVEAAEQWAAEHPIKTRQSEFLKMFPDAPIYPDTGLVRVSPCQVDRALCGNCPTGIDCIECRKAFWEAEVEE